MTWSLPPQVTQALARLQAGGFEAWIVGGCVRDTLLGIPPKDYDLTTSAQPEEIKVVFSGEQVIETGIRHGTVTVVLDGNCLEMTTYRVDGVYSDARHPDQVTFTRSLQEDAARRDFTINAMAYCPQEGLQDFFGGREDLQHKIIRCVGDPEARFQEDALRILRGLRFASVLGFSLEKDTEMAARRWAHLLKEISAERVSTELGNLLCGKYAGHILQTYPDILGQVIPELLPMVGFDQQNIHHCYDLLTHTAVALNQVPARLPLRLAILLHDIGKPLCFALGEDGQGHFYSHAHCGMEMADTILRRLRVSRETRERVVTLIRYHDSVIEETPQRVRRWLSILGTEVFFDLLEIQRGDISALAPAYCTRKDHLDRLEQLAREILAEKPCLEVRDLAVNGWDLLALGYQGPVIGQVLHTLLEQVLEGKVPNEKEEILHFLKDFDAKKKE